MNPNFVELICRIVSARRATMLVVRGSVAWAAGWFTVAAVMCGLTASVAGEPAVATLSGSDLALLAELRRGVRSSDPRVRLALARDAARVPVGLRVPLLSRLLNDVTPDVRAAAIDALRSVPATPELQQVVSRLSGSDPDYLVREYARLLEMEWGRSVGVSHAVVESGFESGGAVPRSLGSRAVAPVSHTIRSPASVSDPIAAFEDVVEQYSFEQNQFRERVPQLPDQRPGVLRDPRGAQLDPILGAELLEQDDLYPVEEEPPLGFTGPSGVAKSEVQESPHFMPIEDRWRVGFPGWDRHADPDPVDFRSVYSEGHWWDPYNQNVLKGDYPILGQHTFLNVTAESQMIHEYREVPTPTTPFESTVNPFQEEFFGDPSQYFYTHFFMLSLDLFHGNAAFKPADWRVKLTPIFNVNYLDVEELGVVGPNVRRGTTRFRDFASLEEWFVEAKLADTSPHYDFTSVRAGSQPFVSDFRGFIFADVNRGVRLFGTRLANRDQFNLVWFDQTEKDTNSGLNTFEDRHQNTVIANYFRQDVIVPGYTFQLSFHYNHDQPSFKFDENNFLVRPDPAGVFEPHEVDSYYFGVAGDGHFGHLNVSHAFYHVIGQDKLNPIAGEKNDINADMAAVELSFDRDWIRFRTSYFFASGDDDPFDGKAEGFDAIFDNPNFAGGEFSYWQRQSVRLFGVGLTQAQSLVPNLRSSKTQGQTNFVNPGLHLVNAGMDFEITPKLKAITNVNVLWFDETETLDFFTFQNNIDNKIGTDLSIGAEYRPLLNDNIQIIAGYSVLLPGTGFKDLYGTTSPFTLAHAPKRDINALHAAFMDFILIY